MIPPRKSRGKDGRGGNKTPSKHQFKPGQSGNPKGRPKKAPSVLDLVEQELTNKYSINIGGTLVKVPMNILLIKQLVKLALKGNTKALFLALEMLDTIQKAKAKRYSASSRPEWDDADLKNMTTEELTALYFETINPPNRNDDDDEEDA